jgi:hypothetical protein
MSPNNMMCRVGHTKGERRSLVTHATQLRVNHPSEANQSLIRRDLAYDGESEWTKDCHA